jgi:hypothetical protein
MTDLEAIRDAPIPRPEPLCRRYAGRMSPLLGFIGYGVLYFAAVVNTAVLGVLFGLGSLFPAPPAGQQQPGWVVGILTAGMVIAFLGAWWPYVRWARNRRRAHRAVVREGALVEGRVTQARQVWFRGAPIVTGKVAFSVQGREHVVGTSFGGPVTGFVEGAQVPVLALPGARFAAVFPDGARLQVGKVRPAG